MERNNPNTSHEAFEAVSETMLQNHWAKILDALKVLKLATYEELAEHIGFKDKNQVSRRLKALELEGLVYKPGTKKLTSSNRNAFQYALTGVAGSEILLPKKPEKYTKETVSAADIACSLIAKTTTGILKQKSLFGED